MPAFSGGVSVDKKGYLVVKAGPCRDVRVHILVAEAMLGRPLRDGEEVHHKDEDKLNPHWTNLQVLDKVTHAGISNKKRWMLKDKDKRELEQIEEYEKSRAEAVPF
jgi:hypothetical protein